MVDAEVDEGLRMIHQNIHLAVSMDGHRDSDAEQQRKMEKIKQFRGAIGGLVAANAAPEDYSATRKEKSLDLEFIDTVRDRYAMRYA